MTGGGVPAKEVGKTGAKKPEKGNGQGALLNREDHYVGRDSEGGKTVTGGLTVRAEGRKKTPWEN